MRLLPIVAVGALLVVPALPAAPADEGVDLTRLSSLRDAMLRDSGGDLSRPGVRVVWTPDGPVEEPITGHEFLAAVAAAWEDLGPRDGTDHVVAATTVGGGHNDAELRRNLDWSPCYAFRLFSLGVRGDQYDAFVHLVPARTGDVAAAGVCDGSYGRTYTWQEVTVDMRALSGGYLCSSAMVMHGAPVKEGLVGGQGCGWRTACLSGNAALRSYNWGAYVFVDIAGQAGYVALGDDASSDRLGLPDLRSGNCVPGPGLPGV